MSNLKGIFLLLLTILLSVVQINSQLISLIDWTVSLLTIEEPKYISLQNITDDVEMRRYPSQYFLCQGEYEYNYKKDAEREAEMLRRLDRYFQGKNSLGVRIPLTSPINLRVDHRNGDFYFYEMCLYLPEEFQKMDPLPPLPLQTQSSNTLGIGLFRPIEKHVVHIVKRPEMTVYAMRFGGYATDKVWQDEMNALSAILKSAHLSYFEEREGPRALNFRNVYDPPAKFWNRRNEIWLLA